MQDFQTWRDLLCHVIQDTEEKTRIARELNISPLILERWADGEARPRAHNLCQLLCALPQHHQVFVRLIAKEFEKARGLEGPEDEPGEIASIFYDRVLSASISVPLALRYWVVSNLVLQQAIAHLDPQRMGMALTVARCMPPSRNGKVRSLRGSVGMGTPPWRNDLEPQATFHGRESLAGYVVSTAHTAIIEDIFDRNLPLIEYEDFSVSVAACPIMRATRIAGCLIASSTQPAYFRPAQVRLLQNYSALLALAFESDEFYEREQIELYEMPVYAAQKPHLATLRRRVLQAMNEAAQHSCQLDMAHAELLVWQQLEEEILASTSLLEDEEFE